MMHKEAESLISLLVLACEYIQGKENLESHSPMTGGKRLFWAIEKTIAGLRADHPIGSDEMIPSAQRLMRNFCNAFDDGALDLNMARVLFGEAIGQIGLRDPENSMKLTLPRKA